jgi:catechol 2,3-dioxygenase-like lactoylglutathione lyase family enzyme
MAFLGIQHIQVTIPSDGEAQARAFYGGVLEMQEIPKASTLADRGGCWFSCGGQELHCGVEDGREGGGRHHPALLVNDLDALRARLEAAGAGIETDRQLPGYRRFYARDPFDNRLEFLEAIEG